ncbi:MULTISPECIES: prepilin peptidase [Prochlorococcus]|uniref:prepilin peptidase n=1 Tax=Prochlorococcus TaxID=1218 RepID=UPI00053395E0|nr:MULTISPECIES: A24 family peptidase [Prochlorococcus]KGG12514.1 Leader peptidase (Prepilin peptidase) [Prochlorococcus sp. MIT 0601]
MTVIFVASFLIGLCFGSFINVLIWRLPRGESPILPRSYCPRCRSRLFWFENIPIVSWLMQKGRCNSCNGVISPRYPIVELFTALLFVICNFSYLYTEDIRLNFFVLVSGWILVCILLSLTFIDITHLILPQSLISLGYMFGTIYLLVSLIYFNFNLSYLFDHFLAAFFSYIIFEFIRLVGRQIYSKEVLGQGDSKLISMLGLWLGIKCTYIAIVLTFIISATYAIIGLTLKKIEIGKPYALGPFIAFSGFFVWIVGSEFYFANFL